MDLQTVDLVDKQESNIKMTKSYAGGVGTCPSSALSPKD